MKIQHSILFIFIINSILFSFSYIFYNYLKYYFIKVNSSINKEKLFTFSFWFIDIISHCILIIFANNLNISSHFIFFIRLFLLYPMVLWELTTITFILFLIFGYLISFTIQLSEKILYTINHFIQNIRKNPQFIYIKKGFIGFIIISIMVSIYHTHSYFIIKTITIKDPLFPKHMHNLTITHLTDIHFGYYMDPNKFKKLAEEINKIESDLLVITGDLTTKWENDFKYAQLGLKHIKKHPYGNYMVLGNHEHYYNTKKAIKYLKEINNFTLLINEKKVINYKGHPIEIIGVDYEFSKNKKAKMKLLNLALKKPFTKNSFKILLTHDPDFFDLALEKKINLILAGHTHGGQIRIPYLEYIDLIFKYPIGFYRQSKYEFNSYLYVSPGLGSSFFFPIRINCPREISIIKIKVN